jgi:crotonobetainyl-CoA:carnitine CoA-transferase CaiB-like acyl-CoA transferase
MTRYDNTAKTSGWILWAHMTQTQTSEPLGHFRLIDLTHLPNQLCARVFADFGAEVIKVEPLEGDPCRRQGPCFGGAGGPDRSLTFTYLNRGKKSVTLDLRHAAERQRLRALAVRADVLVEDRQPGELGRLGLGYEDLRRLHPGLVYVSITPFGQTGMHSSHQGGDLVAQAAGGMMFANGDHTRRPAMAPYELLSQLAGLHAAFGALVALRARRATGVGQHVDVSRQEVVLYCQGCYIPRYATQYEIARREPLMSVGGVNTYRCRDGYVHVAPFMPRHFTRLVQDVMHHPVLSEPEWSTRRARLERRQAIDEYIATHLATVERHAFVETAQRAGVPVIPVLGPDEFTEHPHTVARGFFRTVTQPGVGSYRTAGPPAILGRTPWRVDRPAPRLGEHNDEVLRGLLATSPHQLATPSAPAGATLPSALGDLRLVDFTRAFAGPLATMFLGFFGAEVIKIESADLEDNRTPGDPNYPELHRTKLSCTLDARQPEGQALVKRLLDKCGIVVENFRPGVMDRLHLSYDEVRAARPDVIMLSMPGFGNTGPLRDYYSYGQQVMGMTGLSHLWGHPESPLNARTKYAFPDYVAAITGAVALLVALEHRERTGEGQYIELSQVEALAHLLSVAYMEYTELGRVPQARGNWSPVAAPHDVYPCRGDDAWCAIAVPSQEAWEALVHIMGSPQWCRDERFQTMASRVEHKAALDQHIGAWTATRTPRLVAKILQDAGVPAGIVATAEDLYYDPHLRARGTIVAVDHPADGRIEHAGVNVHLSATPGCADLPTPTKGQHNDYVFNEVLQLSVAERMRLEALGVLR